MRTPKGILSGFGYQWYMDHYGPGNHLLKTIEPLRMELAVANVWPPAPKPPNAT